MDSLQSWCSGGGVMGAYRSLEPWQCEELSQLGQSWWILCRVGALVGGNGGLGG